MRMLIHATEEQFLDLQRRAAHKRLVFDDEELPRGSSPTRGRIGLEIDGPTQCASLLVQPGVHYSGTSPEVEQWLRYGERIFPNLDSLRQWTTTTLAAEYPPEAASTAAQPATAGSPHPSQLTDLQKVQSSVTEPNGAHYVSEDNILSGLMKQVRGQWTALRELCRRVHRHLARIAPRRPLTLLAIGPTGVGKTKTAETLPAVLREQDPEGGGYAYLRIDCSELREAHRVSQLLGAPQGYTGYNEGAQLIDQLAANPKTIVLFDEIEKAHPDVLTVLMNAIDCGRLASPARRGTSRNLDCRRAIFFFTTNLDSEGVLNELEARDAFEKPEIVDQVCRGKLRAAGIPPELVGRMNSFLVFRPLTFEAKAEIVALSVARVAEEYGVHIERVAPELVVTLLSLSKADGFGVRPMEFLIDDKLGGAFAEAAAAKLQTALEARGGPPFECMPIQEQDAGTRSPAQHSRKPNRDSVGRTDQKQSRPDVLS